MDILYNLIMQVALDSTRLLRYYEHMQIKESTIKILTDDFSGGDKGGEKQMPPKYADGSFRKRNKSGLIEYRFMCDGKQVPVYGYSERECHQRRYEYERTPQIKAIEDKPIETPLKYKKWIEQWLKEKKPDCKPGYLKTIEMYLKNDILPKLGKAEIAELTTDKLQTFLCGIKQDNKRTKVAAILSESLRRAYELQKIERNSFIGVRFVAYESPHKSALTHKEQITLLENIKDEKLLTLTKLLLLTGLRQGEALALTADDIKDDSIRITKSWNKYTNSATKPKTKASVRTIPINSSLVALLKPYIAAERLFDYDNDKLSKTYSELFKALNIKATGHSLRHTFITNAFEIGVPPHIVQRWAGHAKAEQADAYLDLRKSKDFIKTDIVNYMIELKNKFVPNLMS